MSLNVKIQADYQEFQSAMENVRTFMSGVLQGMREELHAQAEAAKESMKQQTSAFEDFSQILKSKMSGVTGVVEGFKVAWAQFAVIGETTHLMYEAAEGAAHMAKEAGDLGAKLGTSATEASRLRVSLQLNGVEVNEFTKATNGLNKTILAHEDRLTSVGIATRDANGNLRSQVDLTIDAIAKLNQFKEGTDRNIEAQKLFGKGVQLSDEMLSLTAEKLQEGAKFADAYGLTVGKDGVEASSLFVEATHKVGLILEGLKNAIGQALLPILSELTKWLTENGPFAMNVIKIAIAEVTSIFYGLKFAGQVMYEALALIFKNLMEVGGAFGRVMYDVLHGDFGAAAEDAKQAFATIQTNASQAFGNVVTDATATRDKLANMWGNIVTPKAVVDSGKAGHGTEDVETNKKKAPAAKKPPKAKKDDSAKQAHDALMQQYDNEVKAAEDHYDKVYQILQKELAEEIKAHGENSKQVEKIYGKMEEAERKAKDQMAKLDQMKIAATRDRAAAVIDAEEIEANARYDMGQISEQQMFTLAANFENRRYQLKMDQLQQEADLNEGRVIQHQQTLDKMDQLERQHGLKLQAMAAQQRVTLAQPMMQMMQTMQQGFAQMITGLITRTTSWRDAMKGLYSQVLSSFTNMMAQQLVKHLTVENLKTAATQIGTVIRTMWAKLAGQEERAENAKTGGQSLMASGASVFGKVYDAIAGIPYVGPFLAPVMAIAAMGAVVGMASKIASARGGYDIPAGVNPITQLHEEEMVLPREQANMIRSLADGHGAHNRQQTQVFNVSALDARSLKETLRRNQAGLASAVTLATRNGHFKPR